MCSIRGLQGNQETRDQQLPDDVQLGGIAQDRGQLVGREGRVFGYEFERGGGSKRTHDRVARKMDSRIVAGRFDTANRADPMPESGFQRYRVKGVQILKAAVLQGRERTNEIDVEL